MRYYLSASYSYYQLCGENKFLVCEYPREIEIRILGGIVFLKKGFSKIFLIL